MADNSALDGIELAEGVSSEQLPVGDGEVHLLRGGAGAPLLFLHGAGAASLWTPAHERLARQYEVIAPDHPGFGRSTLLDGVHDVEDLVYHYLDLLDRLELDRVVLVGESFGGWIAAEIAAHSPHRVEQLVLMGAPGLRIPGQMPFDVFLATPQQLVGALFHDPSIAAGMFPAEPTIEQIVHGYTEASAFARYAFSPFLNNPKLERRLYRITAPTLVLWADDDRLVPRAHGERYAERIPNARLQTVEDCGHAMTAERPDAAGEAIAAFLSA
jgi:pimeloyl-ACP methyl ester carboxylesterase